LTRAVSRLARTIIPALLILSLLVACRSGSPTPTSTASRATPSAPPGSPASAATRAAAGTPTAVIATTPTSAVITQTEVVVIKPVDASGLNSTYRRTESVVGSCLGPSLVTTARADAWRCVANTNASGPSVLDPCFAASAESQPALFCFRQPWVPSVSLMVLSAPLPDGRPAASDPTTPQPWGFELADGVRCLVVTESMPLIADQRVNATCTDGRTAIGDVDRSQPAWSILVVRNRTSQPQRIQLARAWY